MLELAIVLPVLLFLVMSIVETGRALNQYLELSHIVYEGARYGASLAGIESGEVAGEASTNQMRQRVISRVEFLLEQAGYAEELTNVELAYHDPDSGEDGIAAHSITVSVDLGFLPIFQNSGGNYSSALSGLSISVDATAPYLFKDNFLSESSNEN